MVCSECNGVQQSAMECQDANSCGCLRVLMCIYVCVCVCVCVRATSALGVSL